MIPLIKGAIQHKGFALLDIISPCVTFNNHDTSTKSYDYIRNHNEAVGKTDFVPLGEEITTSYKSGSSIEVNLHDGSKIALEKVNSKFDPTNQGKSLSYIRDKSEEGKLLTGLLYFDESSGDLHETLNLTKTPLNQLSQKDLCPGEEILDKINKGLS